jgi:4-hydroxy-tetrahydrodipicolinate reductase
MKIALIGYGKMGKAIEKIALAKGHEIVAQFGSKGIDHELLQKADVAIEFSKPEAAVENLKTCFALGVPVICGTTGWLKQKNDVLDAFHRKGTAFLYASNFSIGVNLFFNLNKYLAVIMNEQPQYDVRMEEIHHTAKLDAPSGTAISIAEDILKLIARKKQWTKENADNQEDIPIFSVREDPAPGTHSVFYDSAIDSIEIKHTAHSRDGFAGGAVLAAEWILGKKGIYSMNDVLGF